MVTWVRPWVVMSCCACLRLFSRVSWRVFSIFFMLLWVVMSSWMSWSLFTCFGWRGRSCGVFVLVVWVLCGVGIGRRCRVGCR